MRATIWTCVLLATLAAAFDVPCPPNEEAIPTFHADPDDCSVYYVCSNGSPIKLACPFQTVFNPKLNVCDHPTNVPGCDVIIAKNYHPPRKVFAASGRTNRE